MYAYEYDGITIFIFDDTTHAFYAGKVAFVDIYTEEYRLGGFRSRSIGVGSTRQEVERDFRRRQRANVIEEWRLIRCRCRRGIVKQSSWWDYPHFGYHEWESYGVKFEFYENIVVRMRVGRHLAVGF